MRAPWEGDGAMTGEPRISGSGEARLRGLCSEAGRFMALLVQATRARRLLLVGGSDSDAALWLATAARHAGGQVAILPPDRQAAAGVASRLRDAGLGEVVTLLGGDAAAALAERPEGWDLAIIQAGTPEPAAYVELIVPRLRRGGLLVAQDVSSRRQEPVNYVTATISHPELVSVAVPIGQGQHVSVRRGRPISAQVRQVLAEMEELAKRDTTLHNIPPEAGRFLHVLALAIGARHALEVGTSNGYSAVWLATALQATGGRLVTVERDSGKAKMARKNLRAAGLEERVEVVIGDAGRVLRRLRGPFDLVFFDASKEDQLDHLRLVWDQIAAGGVIVSDNALTHVAELAPYTAYLRSHPQADSMLVPVGSGFEITLKLTRRQEPWTSRK